MPGDRPRAPILLAYAGTPDIAVAVGWLSATYQSSVVTLTVDVGQPGDLEEVRERALAAGALRAHVVDAREAFARDFVLPALKAGALDGDRSVSGALALPLIVRKLVEIAAIEGATTLAHGGEPAGRFELSLRAVAGDAHVVSHGWPTIAGGEVTAWARPTVHAPEPAYVDISFERGAPTAINDVSMPLLDLVASLSTIAGAHLVDRPSRRGIVDSAAVAVLMAAHQALRASTSSADAERFSALVARQYAELVASGLWASPLREALDAYVETLQARMTGRVRLKLFKGHCDIHDDALVRTV